MRFLWIDTETTGLDVSDSAAFSIGVILVDNGSVICERCFFLNPLSDVIRYHESAGKIHGYTEDEIKAFPSEKSEMEKVKNFFHDARELWETDGSKSEKLIAAGYNVRFDMRFLEAAMSRCGYSLYDYFKPVVADVFDQVKKAGMKKALPYLPDRKLGTVAKHLGVSLENAHDAMSDIRATREVAAKLHSLGVNLNVKAGEK